MNVFNNETPGYEEVVSYGPSWWTGYREMDAVYRFAGWTLDLMAYFLEKLVLNQSPLTCDEVTLRYLEKLMGIEYDATASLEARRSVVLAYWSGGVKLTRSIILNIIAQYTDDNVDVFWNGTTLMVYFLRVESASYVMPFLRKILWKRLPAHIGYGVRADDRHNINILAGITSQILEGRTAVSDTISLEDLEWYADEGDVIYVDEENNIIIS